jgi:hypothetical protein
MNTAHWRAVARDASDDDFSASRDGEDVMREDLSAQVRVASTRDVWKVDLPAVLETWLGLSSVAK